MKILLLGANGQLGWELARTCPVNIQLSTCDYPKVDFLSTASIQNCIESANPDWIINASAYTAVDLAETEKQKAFRINHEAVEEIAISARQKNIKLVHISTDYIFSGQHFTPIPVDHTPDPQSVYGQSKLKGEQAVTKHLEKKSLIIRTAWLYSSHRANFVKTMLRLMTEKQGLTVVNDQIGTPTWANGLAKTIWSSLESNLSGIYHWTDAGVASWYDFAVAIQEETLSMGLLKKEIPIMPVPSSKYPTAAKRPCYSVLDTQKLCGALNIVPEHWRKSLRKMLIEI